jgi:Staygreen protein
MRLDPRKLHVTFVPGTSAAGPVVPRAYTLTHSDSTGELFLTIGTTFDRRQISGWYTRLMRDEVLAEWSVEEDAGDNGAASDGAKPPPRRAGAAGTERPAEAGATTAERRSPRLDIHCHVSGGLVFGTAGWRYGILQGHMPLVIEAVRFGDSGLFRADPHLDEAPVWVRFHSARRQYDFTGNWGRLGDYRQT